MNRILPFLALFLSAPFLAHADDPEVTFARDAATDAFELSWTTTEPDRTFFIQFSPDLTSGWHYLPVIEQGSGGYGFWILAERAFFRLRYTDLPVTDPYLADFGGGGIPAGWLLENGLDPFTDYSGLGPNGSDSTYWDLWQLSLHWGGDPANENIAELVVYAP